METGKEVCRLVVTVDNADYTEKMQVGNSSEILLSIYKIMSNHVPDCHNHNNILFSICHFYGS